MGNTPIAPGELVYLLAELRTGDRIHEIGTSARVVAIDGASLTLELGAAGRGTVSCPSEHVSAARTRHVRAVAQRSSPAFRPATA